MARWTPVAYGALVAFGTINREMTAVLLIVSWFALRPRAWRTGVVFALIAAAIYGVIRVGSGAHADLYTLARVWANNTSTVGAQGAVVYVGLLVPLFVAGAANWRRADASLRRLTAVVLAVYLPVWAALAVWQETRLLMPVLILLLPMITARSATSDLAE